MSDHDREVTVAELYQNQQVHLHSHLLHYLAMLDCVNQEFELYLDVACNQYVVAIESLNANCYFGFNLEGFAVDVELNANFYSE